MRPASSAVTFGIRFAGALALAATCAVFASACGSRGPLDDDLYGSNDAGTAADVASVDVTVPDPVDAAPARDAGREAASSSPIDCGVCLFSQCGPAIFACVQSPGCRTAFQCVITDCAVFGYLADVFVVPECRGQGVAKTLMRAILQHEDLQGLTLFLLRTRDAQSLYAQFGFETVIQPEELMARVRPAPAS